MYQLNASKSVSIIWHTLRTGFTAQKNTAVSPERAIHNAFQEFERLYPQWVDSLFDNRFLHQNAAPLFANGRIPTAYQLANVWRSQFNVGTPAQKAADIKKVQPIAAVFLQMVKQELRQ